MSPRRKTLAVAASAAAGAVLFWYALQRVGLDALTEGIRRVGWGILAILAIAGARFALRAQCWRWCLPPAVRLDFRHAFSAILAGDAVGNVTPLGLFASEPMKVLLTRHHLATMESIASLTLENLLYSISVMAMLTFGLVLLLTTVAVPDAVRWVAIASLGATVVVVIGAAVVLRTPVNGGLRAQVTGFARRHPSRLARVFSLQVLFHVLAVAETMVTLGWLMGDRRPTLVQGIAFETINRLTIVVFKFVPFRIGVDEAASGGIAPLLAVTAAAGVALAVVRKARTLFWSAVGLLLLAAHPARTP